MVGRISLLIALSLGLNGKADQIPTVQTFWQPQLTVPVIAIDEDSFSRPSPRIINAAQQICEAIANNE